MSNELLLSTFMVLHSPYFSLPLLSNKSANPNGQHVTLLSKRRWLWSAKHANVYFSTFSTLALIGVQKILHLTANIPKVFSIVRRAREIKKFVDCHQAFLVEALLAMFSTDKFCIQQKMRQWIKATGSQFRRDGNTKLIIFHHLPHCRISKHTTVIGPSQIE